ncbi:MAG: bifunctional D-glycero-beta-D-manno-heptose-7-phosphate kinase/D-glycero-beta-D-manno-heptose 1-phosphate adenylyltransferase HldE [Pseudomonadota bacterium]
MTLKIPNFNNAQVLVAGDVMLDQYWFGATGRISPEAPVPVVNVDADEERPGGAANVAVNLAALGCSARLTGMAGADAAADRLQAVLEQDGIQVNLHRDANQQTTTKLRVLSRGQQLIRLDREDVPQHTALSLRATIESHLDEKGVLVLSDYGKGALHDAADLIAIARSRNARVLVDPKGTDWRAYTGATLITPNESEFRAVAGGWTDDDELVAKARALIEQLSLRCLLITRSERGMLLVESDDEPFSLSTEAREVFDVTGAGDTVIATMAAALATGSGLRDAVALSNLAAGRVVAKIGVASVTPAELRVALHRRGTGGREPVSKDAAIALVHTAQDAGERVVMTNGVFDVLHAGHVAYLEQAKSLGDRLVVAVNDDASVRRLKGASRPINTLEDRMLVLAGLAAVDWVVAFSNDTPQSLIEAILPDVLVKGGDYAVHEIAGGEAVIKAGGEVRVLGFRPGRSTTSMIARIRGETDD